MSNLTKTDRRILGAAILALLLFTYFLYDDSLLFSRGDQSGLEKIGEVDYSTNDVRLKTATAFTWFPAQKTDNLHLQDSIFTGERSEADLRLNDGTRLHVTENSLVTLNLKDGQMSLDLRYGDFSTKMGKGNLLVTAGDKVFDVQGPADFRINKTSGGDVDLLMKEGSARLRGPSGTKVLGKGSISMDSQGRDHSGLSGKIELLTPDNAVFPRMAQNAPVPLQWKGTGPIKTYRYVVCATATCEPPLKSRETKENRGAVTEALKDGTYFWKVQGLDQLGREIATSKTQSINVTYLSPPTVTTPAEKSVIKKVVKILNANDIAHTPAEISWSSRFKYPKFEYQVSRDKNFSAVVHTGSQTQWTATTPELPSGTYYYRVRGLTQTSPTQWSTPAQLNVDLTPKLASRLSTPILTQKKYTFNHEEAKKRSPAAIPAPSVRWKKVSEATSYKVQISRDANFEKSFSYSVPTEELRWPDYKPGVWHVRVQALSENEIPSLPSDISDLQVMIGKPILNPMQEILVRGDEDPTKAPPAEAKALWSEIPEAPSYLVQMDADEGFKKPFQFITRRNSTALKIPKPGTYNVRVAALDDKGQQATAFSDPQKVSYSYKNHLVAPKLLEPFQQASIFLQTTKRPLVWLEWSPSVEAVRYEVQIAADLEFRQQILLLETQDTRLLLQKQIPVGALYWRVRSLGQEKNKMSDWSMAREFRISSQKNEAFTE